MVDSPAVMVSDLNDKLSSLALENNNSPVKSGRSMVDRRRRDRRSKSEDDDEEDEEKLSEKSIDSQQNDGYSDENDESGQRRTDREDAETEETRKVAKGENEDDDFPGERERGDGEEVPHPSASRTEQVDENENRKNPAFVPKRGNFYQHDMRGAANDEEQDKNDKQSKKLQLIEGQSKWKHDLFYEEEQAPKSRQELINMYGYDIRNEGRAPMGSRVRKYGRTKKQEQDWRDPDSYLPHRRRGGAGGFINRGGRHGNDEDRIVATTAPSGGDGDNVVRANDYDEYPPLPSNKDRREPPLLVNNRRLPLATADKNAEQFPSQRARSFEELRPSSARFRREPEQPEVEDHNHQWQRGGGSFRPAARRGGFGGFGRGANDGFRGSTAPRYRGAARYGGGGNYRESTEGGGYSNYYQNNNYSRNNYYSHGNPQDESSSARPVPVMEFRRRSNEPRRSDDSNYNTLPTPNRQHYPLAQRDKSHANYSNAENSENWRQSGGGDYTPKAPNTTNSEKYINSTASAVAQQQQPYELPPRFQQHNKDAVKSGPLRGQKFANDNLNDSSVDSNSRLEESFDDADVVELTEADQRTPQQNLPTGGKSAVAAAGGKRYSALRQHQVVTVAPTARQQQTTAVSPPQQVAMMAASGIQQMQPPPHLVHAMGPPPPPPPQKVIHAYVAGPVPIPFAPAYFDGYPQPAPQAVYAADVTQSQFGGPPPPPPGFAGPPPSEAFCMPRVNPGGMPPPPQAYVTPVPAPAGYHVTAMLPPQYNVPQANEGQPPGYSPHVTYYNTESQQATPRPAPKLRPKSVIPIVSPEAAAESAAAANAPAARKSSTGGAAIEEESKVDEEPRPVENRNGDSVEEMPTEA